MLKPSDQKLTAGIPWPMGDCSMHLS